MKKFVWLGLFSLLTANAVAQFRGGFGGGFGRGAFGQGRFHVGVSSGGFGFRHGFHTFPQQGFINLGIPPLGPIPPLGLNAPFSPFDRRFGFAQSLFGPSVFFGSGFPAVTGGFDYGYPPPTNIIIVQQPALQTAVEEKPREVRPEIREYKEGALPSPVPSQGKQPAFVIALKDGSTHPAIVVWVQEDVVHYLDPERRSRQVPLDRVDREATRKLNRELDLDLWLPAPDA